MTSYGHEESTKRQNDTGLLTTSAGFLRWLVSLTARLLQVERGLTIKTVVTTALIQLLDVLVFLLPLKIILLLGSDGVPKYFQFFITEETRPLWVGILSGAIFILYAVTRILESGVDRWTRRGADSLIGLAERVPIASDESTVAGTSFQRICETTANIVFLVFALAAGLFLYPLLFLGVIALLVAEFAFAAKASGNFQALPATKLANWVRSDTGSFVNLLKSVNFLAVFGFLLAAFLLADGPNRLIAIASILLGRQVFKTLGALVNNAKKLSKQTAQVNALLFTETQLPEEEHAEERELRERYSLPIRLDRVKRFGSQLGAAGGETLRWTDSTQSEWLGLASRSIWIDSGNPKVALFDLYISQEDGTLTRAFREFVYTGKAAKGLERQDFLLRHLSTDAFRGLKPVCTYEEGPLIGRIADVAGLAGADRKTFKAGRDDFIGHLAGLEIPSELIQAHGRAHSPLVDRLQRTVVERIALVIDEPWTSDAFQDFTEQLAPIIARVQQLPQMLVNPALTAQNAMVDGSGVLYLINWRAWTLAPVGAAFNPQQDSSALLLRIAQGVRQRSDGTRNLRLADLLCASLLRSMETFVGKGRPKEALRLAYDTLPLLWLPDADVIAALDDRLSGSQNAWSDEDETEETEEVDASGDDSSSKGEFDES